MLRQGCPELYPNHLTSKREEMTTEQPQMYLPFSITWPLDVATAQAIVDTNGKTVCFVSRHVAEQLRNAWAWISEQDMNLDDGAGQRRRFVANLIDALRPTGALIDGDWNWMRPPVESALLGHWFYRTGA